MKWKPVETNSFSYIWPQSTVRRLKVQCRTDKQTDVQTGRQGEWQTARLASGATATRLCCSAASADTATASRLAVWRRLAAWCGNSLLLLQLQLLLWIGVKCWPSHGILQVAARPPTPSATSTSSSCSPLSQLQLWHGSVLNIWKSAASHKKCCCCC